MSSIHKRVQQDMVKDKFRGEKKALVAEISKRAKPIVSPS